MDELTRGRLAFILQDAETLVDDLRVMLEEVELQSEQSTKVMVQALVSSTDGKRYAWADKFGVDEIQIRRWENGETRPNSKHLKMIKEAYYEITKK